MITYNISGVPIDCIEIDVMDQSYLYHASIRKYFNQNKLCFIFDDVKDKTINNVRKLLNLSYRYKGEDVQFKDLLSISISRAEGLKKEVADNIYNIADIKKLADETNYILKNLEVMYLKNKEEIDNRVEDSYVFSGIMGLFIGAFFISRGKDLDEVNTLYSFGFPLVFAPLYMFAEWKNAAATIISKVNEDIDFVSKLLGQIENLDAFSEKTIELSD